MCVDVDTVRDIFVYDCVNFQYDFLQLLKIHSMVQVGHKSVSYWHLMHTLQTFGGIWKAIFAEMG